MGGGATEHLVVLGVGELQRQLGCLDVKGADARLRPLQEIFSALQSHLPALQRKRANLDHVVKFWISH